MKHGNYVLVAVLLMGVSFVSLASDKPDNTNKSEKASALQKAVNGAAKDLGKGANNLVNAIKEMPDAVGKATNNIKHKDDEK